MGDTVGLEQLQSLPMQLRRLLEAADDTACDQALPEFLLHSHSHLTLYAARQNEPAVAPLPVFAKQGVRWDSVAHIKTHRAVPAIRKGNFACSTPAIRRVA